MDFYPWIVFVHVAAAFAFVLSHGASAFAAFRIRAERDPLKIRALLELSSMTLGTMYVSFLVAREGRRLGSTTPANRTGA